MPRINNMQEQILNVMADNIGLHMTVSRVQENIPDSTRKQVQGALYHMGKKGIVRKIDASTYIYDGKNTNKEESDNSHIYETIGEVAGLTVVRSDNGKLYALKPLEDYLSSSLTLQKERVTKTGIKEQQ